MLKSWLKERTPIGLRLTIGDLRREVAISRLHRKGRRSAGRYANAKSLKLNIGCGKNLKPGWINIDLARNADLSLDMREQIPLSDGSAQTIYSEHFLEHLDYPTDALRRLLGRRRREQDQLRRNCESGTDHYASPLIKA
jgi:hypothetical protein